MAITVDVLAKVVEASLRSSSQTIEGHFLKTGEKSGENFARSMAQAVGKSPDLQKSFDKAADAVGKLRVEQEKLEAINKKSNATDAQKIAQAEKVEKAKRDEARAVNDAAAAYGKLNDAATRSTAAVGNSFDTINRGASGMLNVLATITGGTRLGGLTSELAGMASGFSTAGAAVGGFGASFAAAGLIAGGTVVVGLAAAATGVVALTDKLYDLGSEWDSAFDSIRTKTGATGDMLEQLKESVTDTAGQIPESLSTIGDIAASVATNLRLVGDPAEQLIVSLGHLKHMGFDADVESLGMAFRALSIDSTDYQTVLEQLVNLQQTTGISIGEATGAIEQNAGALKAFGFTAGEVITILRDFEAAGIDPNKGLGALNKAFKELTDAGLEPTKANLQKVFDEIKGFIDSGQITRANNELNTLFGPKGGGLSWVELIKDGQLNLNDLTTAIDAPRSNIQAMADDTYDLGESWDTFVNRAKVALGPLADTVFNFVNDGLDSIIVWVETHQEEIIDFFVGVGDVSIEVVKGISKFIAILTDQVTSITKGLEPLVRLMGNMENLFGLRNTDSGDKLLSIADGLRDFNTAADSVSNTLRDSEQFWDNVKAKWDEAGQKAREAASGIQDNADAVNNQADANDNLHDSLKRLNELGPVPIFGTPGNSQGPVGLPGMFPGTGPRKFAADGATNRYEPGMVPNNRKMMDAVTEMFGVKAAADTGRRDSFGEHASGQALDIMVNPGGTLGTKTAEGQMTGSQINQWLLANAEQFGLRYTIWQGKQWNPDGTTAPNSGQGITGGHWDHVHARVKPGPATGMRRWGPMGGFPADGPGDMGGVNPMNTSALPPGTPSPIPGLQEGPVGSSFGYNEYGEPGYYRPDSDSIRSAERSKTNADKAVSKAEERLKDLQNDIADLEAQRTTLNSQKTDRDIEQKNKQIKDLQDQIADLKDNAGEAQRRLDDARQGRFTPAREATRSRGGGRGGSLQIGAPLADDLGISEGLPGMAKFLTTFLANLAFAPAAGALAAVAQSTPTYGAGGLIGMGALQNPSMIPSMSAMGPTPLGGGLGGGLIPGLGGGVGPAAGPGMVPGLAPPGAAGAGKQQGTPQTSMAPAPGTGGGFGGVGSSGIGGLAMQGISAGIGAAGLAMDGMMPGAGTAASMAAQIGLQVGNRTSAYLGQLGAIGVGGLMETFLPRNSPIADPNNSWIGRIAGGISGARPALPNSAGGEQGPDGQPQGAGESAPPQSPEEAAKIAQQTGGGQSGGPMVNVENLNNYAQDGGQSVANQIGRMQMASYASGMPR